MYYIRTRDSRSFHLAVTNLWGENILAFAIHVIKPGLHVSFLPFCTVFLTVLKFVECIPLVLFTHNVTKCKKRSKVPPTKTG